MFALLTTKGLVVPYDTLLAAYKDQKGVAALYKKCTLRYRPRIGQEVVVRLHKEVSRPGKTAKVVVYLPRGAIGELVSRGVEIRCNLPAVSTIDIAAFHCELFPNQQIIVDRLLSEFSAERRAAGTAVALLNLLAGMGKTFVAAAIIYKVALPTLYIVPTDYLANQAVKDLRGCFDEALIARWDRQKNRKVKKVKVGKKTTENADSEMVTQPTSTPTSHTAPLVTVVVINSALLEPPEFFHKFGLVIYDEVHTFCANKRSEVFSRTTWAALGMSATTNQRKDTFDAVSHWHLTGATLPSWKPSVIYAEKIPGFTMDDVKFDCRVRVIKYKGPAEFTATLCHPSTGKMFTPWMHKQFLQDAHRTQIILAELRRLYDWVSPTGQRHRIFVFCEERGPLEELYGMLADLFDVDAPELHDQVGTFIGGTKPTEVARVKRDARVILTTYGYSSTGISIVDMTAIIFWTSRRSNMLQIIPRIMRRGGDMSIPREITDLVDWSTPMRSQHYERRNTYQYYSMRIDEFTCDVEGLAPGECPKLVAKKVVECDARKKTSSKLKTTALRICAEDD